MNTTKKNTTHERRQAAIEKNKRAAVDAYVAAHANACELIDRLRDAVSDLREPEDLEIDITWADAEELSHLVSLLEHACKHAEHRNA